ncbi:MAG: hypothetical protein LBC99_07590 [Spirochaetota bacterium]|jgi:phosphotransferase system HPr-like phosphotransfer protein|nr:hypothetical protein [Spirochaetota bacterium]
MPPAAEKQSVPLTGDTFLEMMKDCSAEITSLCRLALDKTDDNLFALRSFALKLNFEAAQVEESLDKYGAKKNSAWCVFRSHIAAVKSFSEAVSKILLINEMIPRYRLMVIEGDFQNDTLRQISLLGAILTRAAQGVLAESGRLELLPQERSVFFEPRKDAQFTGTLSADKKAEHVAFPAAIIVQLTTAFLLESDQSQLQKLTAKLKRSDYAAYIPDVFSEKILRIAEEEFHNLQSMYDTHISSTDIEHLDGKLPVIRDHISLIYTLLEFATILAHYYERHIMRADHTLGDTIPVQAEELLIMLVEYAIRYAGLFMQSAQRICQAVLKRFSEQSVVKVSSPVYRGFHVRPSTLIAKIVLHYGSEVSLVTSDGSLYDASSPLELFRVNEKINAEKRRILFQRLALHNEIKNPPSEPCAMQEALKLIFFDLLSAQEITVYGANIPFGELTPNKDEDFPEYVKRILAFLLAQGLIDIRIDTHVQFVGDKHVLDDIAILAQNGYAEDNFGNDIMLPKELGYLHR